MCVCKSYIKTVWLGNYNYHYINKDLNMDPNAKGDLEQQTDLMKGQRRPQLLKEEIDKVHSSKRQGYSNSGDSRVIGDNPHHRDLDKNVSYPQDQDTNIKGGAHAVQQHNVQMGKYFIMETGLLM